MSRLNDWLIRAWTAVLMLAHGCTVVNEHVRVTGWPDLKEVVRLVPEKEMRAACDKYAPPFMYSLACSEFYLDQGECVIWLAKENAHLNEGLMRHERMHCQGYDHHFGGSLTAMLRKWRERQN